MSNLEAVEVLKNTDQMVALIIARVKDREVSSSEEEGRRHQEDQQLENAMVVSTPDDPYSMIF